MKPYDWKYTILMKKDNFYSKLNVYDKEFKFFLAKLDNFDWNLIFDIKSDVFKKDNSNNSKKRPMS